MEKASQAEGSGRAIRVGGLALTKAWWGGRQILPEWKEGWCHWGQQCKGGAESQVGEAERARAAELVTTQRAALPGGILGCGPAMDRLRLKITLAAVWKENVLEGRNS